MDEILEPNISRHIIYLIPSLVTNNDKIFIDGWHA